MSNNLADKTKKGFIWSAIETFSGQAVQFVIGVILARLLDPSVFGIIGMLTIFLALSDSIIDSGFGNALMQKKDRNQNDYSTVFYINVGISIIIYIIMFIAAPYIAAFYDMPILNPITKVISLKFVLTSLMLVQVTKITIELNFKKLTKIRLTCSIISGICGIILAYSGFGVWSLVAQQLINALLQVVLIWTFSRWIPSLCFSTESFNKLFKYGSKLLLTGLYGPIFENINNLIIGKFYTPMALGYYARAHSLVQYPSSNITTIINRVSFPVLCSMQDDDVKLLKSLRRLVVQTYFIVFPLMFGLLAAAGPLVDVLLTSKWADCVPYIRILCLSMSLYPLCGYNIDAILSKGHSDIHLRLDVIKKVFIIAVLAVTASISVTAICIGAVISTMFSWLLVGHYAGKTIQFTIGTQIKDLFPSFIISIIMMIVVYFIEIFGFASGLTLLLQIITGIIVYGGLSFLFNKTQLVETFKLLHK